MASYDPLSELTAGSSGNAADKSGPKGLPKSAFGSSTVPAKEIIQKRADYVIINQIGTYAFFYETSGSIGHPRALATHGGSYTTGSVYVDVDAGQQRLNIQPVAWRQTDAAGSTGDVTFVYKGGL
mgnify:CR=1 FL=1